MRKLTFALSLWALSALATPASANVDVLFTSANHGAGTTVVADRIAEVMGRAERFIHIAIAHYNSERLTEALIAVHRARNQNADPGDDVEIRVMLDMGEYGDKKSKAKRLEAAGIDVRYKTYSLSFHHPESQLMHHKFMIVDGLELVTGSYNWSDTAEKLNYENVLHYYRRNVKQVIADFQGEFDKLWKLDRERYVPFMATLKAKPGDPEYQPVIPVHFNNAYFDTPMSLDRSEVKALRSAAARLGYFSDRANVYKRYFDREARLGLGVDDAPAGSFLSRWQESTENPGSAPADTTPQPAASGPGAAGAVDAASPPASATPPQPSQD